MTSVSRARFLHTTALVVGEAGVLIEGASGSGKSTLAATLVAEAARAGRFASLVGDDRVRLSVRGGRLIARPHPAIAGLLELRGLGLVAVPHEPACVLRLVIRLGGPADPLPARLPVEPPVWRTLGIGLPLLELAPPPTDPGNIVRIMEALRAATVLPVSNESNLLANSLAMHKIAPHDEAGLLRNQL